MDGQNYETSEQAYLRLKQMFGQQHDSGLSNVMNTDEFYQIASKRFGAAGCITGVMKEAERLRSLARDIKELKTAGLI